MANLSLGVAPWVKPTGRQFWSPATPPSSFLCLPFFPFAFLSVMVDISK